MISENESENSFESIDDVNRKRATSKNRAVDVAERNQINDGAAGHTRENSDLAVKTLEEKSDTWSRDSTEKIKEKIDNVNRKHKIRHQRQKTRKNGECHVFSSE